MVCEYSMPSIDVRSQHSLLRHDSCCFCKSIKHRTETTYSLIDIPWLK